MTGRVTGFKRMGNHLNSILSRWLKAEDLRPPALDCVNCTMASVDHPHQERWRKYKCCTFQPFFPNFYLGAILNDSPRELASHQVHLGPLGMIATQEFRSLCLSTPEESKGERHLCSFYDAPTRRCTVWAFRPGECSSYYCQPTAGFSELSEKTFAVESAVAQMAMIDLGYSAEDVALEVETLNSGVSAKVWPRDEVLNVYRRSWQWSLELKPEQIHQWLDSPVLNSTNLGRVPL